MGCFGSVTLIVIICFLSTVDNIQWLGLSTSALSWNRTANCVQASKLRMLAKVQKKACKRYLPIMPILAFTGQRVIGTCQDMFDGHRWNCSSITTAPNFGPDLTKGTREQAYVYALSTTSLVHMTARACSEGRVMTCSCGRASNEPPPGDFVWGGCADNVKYGVLVAKAFTEMPFNRRKFRKNVEVRINRHNSRAGWRSVQSALSIQCKCHGVSGSCNVKTCWQSLSPLKDLALRLRRKYQEAEEVENKRVGGGTRWKLFPVAPKARFNKDDLIYTTKSPDYCIEDASVGSSGTKGRRCNLTSTDSDSCENMCCGRGHVTTRIQRQERCNCKYHWCCYVTCDTCEVRQHLHLCQ